MGTDVAGAGGACQAVGDEFGLEALAVRLALAAAEVDDLGVLGVIIVDRYRNVCPLLVVPDSALHKVLRQDAPRRLAAL